MRRLQWQRGGGPCGLMPAKSSPIKRRACPPFPGPFSRERRCNGPQSPQSRFAKYWYTDSRGRTGRSPLPLDPCGMGTRSPGSLWRLSIVRSALQPKSPPVQPRGRTGKDALAQAPRTPPPPPVLSPGFPLQDGASCTMFCLSPFLRGLVSAQSSRMGRDGPPTTRTIQPGALLPGDSAMRMRQRYHCHPKFPRLSPVWVRQLLYWLAPSLGL